MIFIKIKCKITLKGNMFYIFGLTKNVLCILTCKHILLVFMSMANHHVYLFVIKTDKCSQKEFERRMWSDQRS